MSRPISAEKQAQINAQVREQQIKNKKELYEIMTRNYGDQPPVQQTVESGFKTVAQKLKEEKKERDTATFRRAVIMKLREQRMDPTNEKLIEQGVKQLQTSSCNPMTGIVNDETVEPCIGALTFSQNGAKRRNRTKHRRSRHKRTRRYRKN